MKEGFDKKGAEGSQGRWDSLPKPVWHLQSHNMPRTVGKDTLRHLPTKKTSTFKQKKIHTLQWTNKWSRCSHSHIRFTASEMLRGQRGGRYFNFRKTKIFRGKKKSNVFQRSEGKLNTIFRIAKLLIVEDKRTYEDVRVLGNGNVLIST